jgi:2-(1,2-epoxy-1,2-dihydrophenyl)acetyl-CoA isomerase
MDEVRIERNESGLIRVTLNRPERRNALSIEMLDALADLFESLEGDPQARALLLDANGPSFCAGADASHRRDGVPSTALETVERLGAHAQRMILALYECRLPTVAAIAGAAVGGGLDLALACDIRLAGPGAVFSESYVQLGLVPGLGGCFFLPRVVGPSRALEMLLTGERLDAHEAARAGLVSRVVEDDHLSEVATALAERLAAGPPVAMGIIKRAVREARLQSLAEHLRSIANDVAIAQSTDDAKEGVAAFFDKRPPSFTGK